MAIGVCVLFPPRLLLPRNRGLVLSAQTPDGAGVGGGDPSALIMLPSHRVSVSCGDGEFTEENRPPLYQTLTHSQPPSSDTHTHVLISTG